MPRTHLTLSERYCIQDFLVMRWPVAAIAAMLGRDRTTIWREIRRNRNHRNRYEGHHAHNLAVGRRQLPRRNLHLTAEDWACVRACLEQDWSPEQISLRFAALGILSISTTTIYLRLHRERRTAMSLWPHLRQGHRQRRRRPGRRPQPSTRGPSIHTRPPAVEQREEIGHWEVDTMVGEDHHGAVVTAVERATGKVLIGKLAALTADELVRRLVWLLRGESVPIRSLTMDNGSEMSGWRRLEAALSTRCYFSDPYCAWQRGTNENTNGLIRQYFLKGASLKDVTQRECTEVTNRLNARPRKRLGGFTPEECYGS